MFLRLLWSVLTGVSVQQQCWYNEVAKIVNAMNRSARLCVQIPEEEGQSLVVFPTAG